MKNNDLTGWQEDAAIELAVNNYVTEINKQFDMKEFEQPLSNLMHDSLLGTFCAIFFYWRCNYFEYVS